MHNKILSLSATDIVIDILSVAVTAAEHYCYSIATDQRVVTRKPSCC